jgi:hypothetical protein
MNDDFDYFPFVSNDRNDAWDCGGPCIDDIEYDDGVDCPDYIVTGCNDDDN